MSPETELLGAVARVVGVFDSLAVDYFIGGSVASSLFGEPRQTVDADVVARVLAHHVDPLLEQLAGEFYADRNAILNAIAAQGCFNLIHLATMAKVDVFVRWRDPFAQSQFARRRRKSVGENTAIECILPLLKTP